MKQNLLFATLALGCVFFLASCTDTPASHVMDDGTHMDGMTHSEGASHVMDDGTHMDGMTHSEGASHVMDDGTESQ